MPQDRRGDRRSRAGSTGPKPQFQLGIPCDQSSRWQKLAAIPEERGNAEGDTLKRRGRTEKRPRSYWVCSDG
jgi:hypothetical protein